MNADTAGIRHALARLSRRSAFGVIAMVLAVLACYGVLALTVLLPLLGIRLMLNESVWSGAIVLFTVLTALAMLPGIRVHGARMPAALAAAGAALILHALLVDYDMLIEFAGFVLLAIAVFRDVYLHRRVRNTRTAENAAAST